jgi:RNA polymerase sigma-70 factor (ECF subfamily)
MGYVATVTSIGANDGRQATDEEIVRRVVAGETALFELVMRRHNRRVFRATRAILRSDDEAEDAMQAAYVSAFAHLSEFDGRARFSTWLTRIAVHEALGRLRRGKRLTSLDDEELEEPMATTRSPEGAASDGELRAFLEKAILELPVGFRTVFVLRAVEEMDVEETALALDIPEETVRTRLHRARALLRDNLARTLDDAAPQTFEFHLSRCDRVVAGVLARIRRP